MPNSSKDSQFGYTNQQVNSGSTEHGHDICSSKQPPHVSLHVPIARDPEFHVTFITSYLKKLWTKHHYTDTAPFHCICSENPCSIQELLRALGISKSEDIRLFLQRTASCLDSISECSGRSIKSSGATKKKSKFRRVSGTGKTSR